MQTTTNLVHRLDSESFEPFVQSRDVVLVSGVVLPFSDRSQNFVPTFEKIARTMQHTTSMSFTQINFIDNGEALLPYNLSIFPHVMLFQGLNDVRHYHGTLTLSALVSYVDRFLELPVISKISEDSLPDFKWKADAVVVGYIAARDEESKEQFRSLAKAMHPEFVFGTSHSFELARSEGIDPPGVAVYRVNDAEMATIVLSNNTDQMTTALRKAGRPLIIDLAFNTHSDFLDMEIPFGYVFADTKEQRSQIRKEIEPLARQHRQYFQFAIADPVDLENIVDDLHLNVTHFPAFAIREPVANLRYPMDETSNAVFIETVETFVQDFLNDKLQPTIKSEPLPREDPKKALVKIVGLSYQDIVMDDTKDVLVVYCITPCGPCEVLQPTVEALAQLYASDPQLRDQVTVGKVMYDANDTPERGIRAFPTIKLFPAASKGSPVIFEEARTLDDLANFIRDEGTYHAGFRSLAEAEGQAQKSRTLREVCRAEDGACAAIQDQFTGKTHASDHLEL